jgi:hypothetical protein
MRELEVAVKARRRDGMVVDEVELGKYLRAAHEDRTKDERSDPGHILLKREEPSWFP